MPQNYRKLDWNKHENAPKIHMYALYTISKAWYNGS